MMALFLYGIFCLTTAIMATVYLLTPVLNSREEPIEHPFLIYLVFFVISIITAPILFYSTISPSASEVFKEYLAKGLFPQV